MDREVTDKEIIDASTRANAHNFITTLQDVCIWLLLSTSREFVLSYASINEVLASFLRKLFNRQIVGTGTNKYRLMILHYGVSLLQNML